MRRRWIAAIGTLVVLAALVGLLFGIKIGQASSGSLASSGPAFETLQTLEKGDVPTGVLTPIEVLSRTDGAKPAAATLAKVDGVAHASWRRERTTSGTVRPSSWCKRRTRPSTPRASTWCDG